MASPWFRTVVAVLAALGSVATLASCGDDDTADAAAFCAEVDSNKQQLTTPRLQTEEDVNAYVSLYEDIGELAPLQISDEWDDLTSNYHTAATVDAADTASVERAKQEAYSSEASAAAVARWLRRNCDVRLGPVTTIVPHGEPTAPAATTTTVPG